MVAHPARTPAQHAGAVAAQVTAILAQVLCAELAAGKLARARRVLHYARLAAQVGRALQQREGQPGQQKVREVVGLQLHVVAVCSGCVGEGHHARVAAQHVQASGSEQRLQRRARGAHAGKGGQVTVNGRDHCARSGALLDELRGCRGAGGGAVQQDHVRALLCARQRRHQASARGGASDGDGLAPRLAAK